jgi:hypothetical protein
MDTLDHIPQGARLLLAGLVEQLRQVEGMVAVVLGGSYASGAQHAGSDLDVGLYYEETQPFAIAEIRRIAEWLAAGGQVTVTGFYGWGAWVNGGAWIHIPVARDRAAGSAGALPGKVDFLYRNLDQLQRTIDEAQQGIVHHDYDQQPAYGFYSVIYLAETQICIPLYDPEGRIAALKRQVQVYPPRLKQRIVADSLWSAEFTLLHGRDFAAQGDVYNTAGCLARAAANLTQALFALNERYFLRDKQVIQALAAFPILPAGYVAQVERILAHPGSTPQELAESVGEMENVWASVVALEGVNYRPQFRIDF